ncbi:uncharacterized protein N0V89_003390 [Didymosphaeria variabile]|uniref:SRR1-like domain-containing protein n=1 Tax=Didymosphaeria variabile TaxID=1932322 RepID=A0A9W9CBF5_9PLEO|nr:uncharacterized protein N0V89_003390 [Didymosphaeria variabile]KAJ4355374.1 hypothetical protein N0V89_003390 [Didymosphaeria variabile]
MSDRRGQWKREKRQHVQSDDGWTVVSGGRPKDGAEAQQLQSARPTRTVGGLTEEKLLDELNTMERKWEKTSCAKNLARMLSLRDWMVTEAVCIGIGSFSIDWDHRYRSMWQLVLFRAVVKTVQQEGVPLALYAQEPAFTPIDISFLSRLKITATSSGIESRITSRSFIYAPFVDWYILLPLFLKEKDPELYIGNEILGSYGTYANTKEKKDVLEECNGLGKKFAKGRERRRVPDFEEHGNALEGLMIYWKEEEDEDD